MTELSEQLIDGGPGQEWQVCTGWVNACAPTRPLPLRHNLISSIVASFRSRHLSGLAEMIGPPMPKFTHSSRGRSRVSPPVFQKDIPRC
jgi:hypothetical protein